MTEPRQHSYLGLGPSGFHRLAYVEWGDPANPRLLICVHGLTRQGRDFDALALALSDRYRVICPDVAGRGNSQWLARAADYNYPQYCADMNALLNDLGAEHVDWVGTSMGGLIGVMLAALPGTPLQRLVLNDVGPLVPKAAQERIAAYVGRDPHFASAEDARAYLSTLFAPWGKLSPEQWDAFTLHSIRREPYRWRLHYDPAIASAFKGDLRDFDIWSIYDRITSPTLVLRGVESDLLTVPIATEMTQRGPKPKVVEIPACGHAPSLMAPEQIALIRAFLG